MDKSWRTAIRRKDISLPTKFLVKENLIKGMVLDYGCGYGFDADSLGFEKYDPRFFPQIPKI